MINIDEVRKLCKENKINWTAHILKRIQQRNIMLDDVLNAVLNGEIIEQYENTKSCLILGKTLKNADIHIVCCVKDNVLMITAYYPDERFDKANKKRL